MRKKVIIILVIIMLTSMCRINIWAGDPLTQSGWNVWYVDSEEMIGENGAAVNMFDGNINTIWHTEWLVTSPSPPHEIQIDLGLTHEIDGFRYLPRQDGGANGRISQYEFYVSVDGSDWGVPVATGTFANNSTEKEVTFTPKNGRFVRLVALGEVNNNPWTSMAEINVLITPVPQPGPFNLIEPPGIINPVLTAADVTDVNASFVADPFIFNENGMWYMFLEVFIPSVNRGDIGLATSLDGLHWDYQKIVLSENFHHSYPLVLKHNGSYYMIPESYQVGAVRVYRASNFPYDWSYVSTIVSGRAFVDPSIFQYNNKWWMFVSDTSNSFCYLYYSNNLLTGWIEHPMSPIISGDASKARLGGRSFVYDNNRIIRIVQKDNVVYGEKVRAFEVDVLNETQYAEHEIPESPILSGSGIGWNATGMHHFDPSWTGSNWLCVVDGHNNGTFSIGIYITPNNLTPNGIINLPSGDVTINVGDWVDFMGIGDDPDGNYPLSYLWQYGTGSGISNSTDESSIVQFNNAGSYTVNFTVTDALGLSDPTPATRTVTVSGGSQIIPQGGWSLLYVDSEELVGENGAAVNAFDGKINTIWHTKWSGTSTPLPHEIRINLGLTYQIAGFRYLPRQDGAVNGRISQYEFYVSVDGSDWGVPVATGTFVNNSTEKEVIFTPKNGRFVRLVALSEVNGDPWTSMAEINVMGNPSPGNNPPNGIINLPSGDVTINVGDWVDFIGVGNDPDGNYPLSYLWQYGTGSGIPNSTDESSIIQFNNPGVYTVTFKVTDALGLSDPTPATRTITVSGGSQIIPQGGWNVLYVDSEELVGENSVAGNAFDGNINTIWHTKWSGTSTPLPHEIQIDLGLTYQIAGFRYLPRQDGGVNGRISQYEFYVSADGSNWGVAVAKGTFVNNSTEKEVVFTPKNGRFVRLVALSEVNGNPWTSMAEINVMGNPSPGNNPPDGVINLPSGDVTINMGDWVDFIGVGDDPDGNYPLGYLWQYGTGSGISNSTDESSIVQFNNPGIYTVNFTVTDALGLSDPTPAIRTVTVSGGSQIIPQGGWSLLYVDSEELVGENGAAVNVFDGNINTIWHTKWFAANSPLPHEIQIDLGLSYEITGFRYLPRQDGDVNGRISQYEFYVSADGSNWGVAVATGTFVNNSTEKEVTFTPKNGRFVRLVALSEVNGNPWTSMAEINVLRN